MEHWCLGPFMEVVGGRPGLTPSFDHSGDFMREPKVYEDLTDLTVLKTAMETALNEYNLSPAVVPMHLVLFRDAIEHSGCFLFPLPSPASQL